MTHPTLRLLGFLVIGLAGALLALLGDRVVQAQPAPPPPPPLPASTAAPPPPPPPAVDLRRLKPPVHVVVVGRGQARPKHARPRRRHPRRRGSSPYGRFYLGAGAGFLWTGGEVGRDFDSGGTWVLWTGWRKGWLGFEAGYLGARLTRKSYDVLLAEPTVPPGGSPQGLSWDPYAGDATLAQLTMDAKIFLTVFCRSSLFARIGLNYTRLDFGQGYAKDGFGWQSGAGWDYRIRLSFAPDVILKLRAEALYTWAKLKCGGSVGCKDLSGVAALFYVNLGWSPW